MKFTKLNVLTTNKRSVFAVMLFVLFSITANALNLQMVIVDYNTLNPVENATIKVYNGTTHIVNGSTDSNGIFNFTNLESEVYTIITTANAYVGDNRNINLSTNDSLLIALLPISADGLIRFRYSDLTGIRIKDWFGGNHEICIYYANNDRLQDCYTGNETIQLLENQDYVVRIKPTRQDMINSPNNLLTFTRQYTRYLIVLIFLLCIIGVFYYVQKNHIFN